jgi:glycosyltransferase involved in cell wall biosynthesis
VIPDTTTRISIIRILLNAERFLDQAMQNVPRQRFTDLDLILLDEGSTDGGTAIARRYVGLHYPGLTTPDAECLL